MRAPWRRRRPEPRQLTPAEVTALTTGLAGFCAHGVGMLDACDDCSAAANPPPAFDPELLELNVRMVKERDEAAKKRGALALEVSQLRLSLDLERQALTQVRQRSARLAEDKALLVVQNAALRARSSVDEAAEWKRRAEADRRNCVMLADALALAEGRDDAELRAALADEKSAQELRDVVRSAVAKHLRGDLERTR